MNVELPSIGSRLAFLLMTFAVVFAFECLLPYSPMGEEIGRATSAATLQ